MADEENSDKQVARKYLNSMGISTRQNLLSEKQYAEILNAPDTYGGMQPDPALGAPANAPLEVSDDPNYDNEFAPALDEAPQAPSRAPQSVAPAEVEPTQGVPASLAEPVESGTLPVQQSLNIDPLGDAPTPSAEKRYEKLVLQYQQSLANQDYASGAGKKSPEEAAKNWAEYTKKAQAMAVDTMAKEHDEATRAARYAEKAAASQADQAYQQQLGSYKKTVASIEAENVKRAKVGLPLLDVPEPPQAPDHGPVDSVDSLVLEQIIDSAAVPNAPEVHEAAHEALAPVRQERARAIASEQVNTEIAGYAAEDQKRAQDAQNNLIELEKREVDDVRAVSLQEMLTTGSLGRKLGAAFAVMLGGVSQGLTGAKTNPVMDYINGAVEQQAQKDKLTLAKKESLRKLIIEEAQLKIQTLSQQTDNMYKKGQLQLEAQKLVEAREASSKAIQKELYAQMMRARANELLKKHRSTVPAASPEIEQENREFDAALDSVREHDQKGYDEAMDKFVVLPNGKKTIAGATKEQVNKFSEFRSETESALASLKDLQQFSKVSDWFNPKHQAQVKSKLNILAGKLRIPLTGPGILTPTEFNRILRSIGNPLGITNVANWEHAKLSNVIGQLDNELRMRAQNIGVNWPMTTRQLAAQKLKATGKYSDQQIDAALDKQGL